MRSYFYTLLNDLSTQMQLPFNTHMEGSRVSFKVDKAYRFGLGLDHSEQFLLFECVLLDKKFVELDSIKLLRWNLIAAYHEGYFIAVDHMDSIVLLTRLSLQGLEVAQTISTIQTMLNIADRFTRGELPHVEPPPSQVIDFLSKV